MKLFRIGFLAVTFMALVGVSCCAGRGAEVPQGQAIVQDEKDLTVFTVHGRIIRDRAKKQFSTGWGFRSASKEPVFFLLKEYPKEFDSNAGFMNERRAKLKLKILGGGEGTIAKPFPGSILEVVDISRNLSGN